MPEVLIVDQKAIGTEKVAESKQVLNKEITFVVDYPSPMKVGETALKGFFGKLTEAGYLVEIRPDIWERIFKDTAVKGMPEPAEVSAHSFNEELKQSDILKAAKRQAVKKEDTGLVHALGALQEAILAGALINDNAASLGKQRLILTLEEVLYRLGLVVVELEALGTGRLQLGDGLFGFQTQLLLGGQFITRGNPDDVAVLAHIQTACIENDVQCLIPRNVLQPQCQRTSHRVTDNDVKVGEVGNNLQHGPDFDILEVERQLFTLITAT